jgi:hypothetical protein
MRDIEGKAPKAFGASEWSRGEAGDIDGKTERSKCPGGHESMWATNEFQPFTSLILPSYLRAQRASVLLPCAFGAFPFSSEKVSARISL